MQKVPYACRQSSTRDGDNRNEKREAKGGPGAYNEDQYDGGLMLLPG